MTDSKDADPKDPDPKDPEPELEPAEPPVSPSKADKGVDKLAGALMLNRVRNRFLAAHRGTTTGQLVRQQHITFLGKAGFLALNTAPFFSRKPARSSLSSLKRSRPPRRRSRSASRARQGRRAGRHSRLCLRQRPRSPAVSGAWCHGPCTCSECGLPSIVVSLTASDCGWKQAGLDRRVSPASPRSKLKLTRTTRRWVLLVLHMLMPSSESQLAPHRSFPHGFP